MDYKHEFGTVDLLLNSDFKTKGVDAFVISLLKAEKQMRKIFTYLIFQNPNYSNKGDSSRLREALAKNRQMYFENFIEGIDLIYYRSVEEIYGESYTNDLKKLTDILKDRDKIFHGQVTLKSLSRNELIAQIDLIRKWCKGIATKFQKEIGYDGFGRNSYRKSSNPIALKHLDKFSSIENYIEFLITIDRSKKKKAQPTK